MPAVNKHFDSGAKRTAIKLWRGKFPYRAIMKKLGMSKATLKRFWPLQGQLFSLSPIVMLKTWR
jgi:DNA invertase Pin-like site-specific DNA recombinase